MDDDSEDTEDDLLSERKPRRSCFYCKAKLENSQNFRCLVEILLGAGGVLHIWAFVVILFCVRLGWGDFKYSTACIPLILLTFEVWLTCFVVFCLIVNDLYTSRPRGINLWQRQALAKLARNLSVSFMIGLTLILSYFELDKKKFKFLDCLWPSFILNLIMFLRYLIIKADYSGFWLLTSLAGLAFQVLIVLKIDFRIQIEWDLVLIPVYAEVIICFLLSVYQLSISKSSLSETLSISIIASGLCLIICGMGINFYLNLHHYSIALAILGLSLSTIGSIQYVGSFFLDMMISHIDFNTAKPKSSLQNFSYTAHSI